MWLVVALALPFRLLRERRPPPAAAPSTSETATPMQRPTTYLTGVSNDTTRHLARGDYHGRLGVLIGPATGGTPGAKDDYSEHITDYHAWGADNGCFTNAGAFNETEWLAMLDRIVNTIDGAWNSCLFAVAPDVYDPIAERGEALPTIERALPVFPKIRALGIPAAMVLQDGIEDHIDQIPWNEFDVAFVGGSDEFKLGYPSQIKQGSPMYRRTIDERTEQWAKLIWECYEHGKPVHIGRVNSAARLRFAQAIGASSADGTFLRFAGTTAGTARLTKWLDQTQLDQTQLAPTPHHAAA